MSTRSLFIACFLILTLTDRVAAQTPAGLPGKWMVTKVIVSEDSKQKDGVQMMCHLFTRSVFQLRSDQSAAFDCTEPDLAIRDGKWKYNAQKKSIEIMDPANSAHVLMSLQVKNEAGKWFFQVDDSPFMLEVAKL